MVKDDPWWLDTKATRIRLPYVQEAVLGPTMPAYNGFNPAWGQVNAEQLWGSAHADVIKNGDDAGGRGGQGVQAGRGDIREVYVRLGSRIRPAAPRRLRAGLIGHAVGGVQTRARFEIMKPRFTVAGVDTL